MKKHTHISLFRIGTVLLIAFVLAACAKPTATSNMPTITPTDAVTEAPTATAVPASLFVVDPKGYSTQGVEQTLQDIASVNGLIYLSGSDLTSDLSGVKIAVIFGDAAVYKEQAAAHPEIQFIFVGATAETAAGNISLVNNRPQDLAFMAGYLATLAAEDWRSGGLLASNAISIDALGDAFINGGQYVCGNCTPNYPPFMNYPVYQDVSGKTTAVDLEGDTTAINLKKVDTVFVTISADIPEVLEALDSASVKIIGDNSMSANAARYAAILSYDALSPLGEMLPKLLEGQGAQTAVSKVVLAAVNDSKKISPAKQGLFATTAVALAEGWIIPLSIP